MVEQELSHGLDARGCQSANNVSLELIAGTLPLIVNGLDLPITVMMRPSAYSHVPKSRNYAVANSSPVTD